jgi:hypothetical protein
MINVFALQARTPFPLDEIRAHLDAMPMVSRDRWDDATYMLADTPQLLQFALEQREAHHTEFSSLVVLVELSASRVLFSLHTREVETARAFTRWVRRTYDVAVLSERLNDITAATDDDLTNLFGALPKRRVAPVGFFRELKHGRADGPSLREVMRDKSKPGESRIAAYLRAAPILLHALGPVTDVLEPKGDYLCAPNIHTDGVYAWPEDLAHYVERYHVALPAEFLAHLAAAKWTAPTEVDTSTIELG